jgi:hypothetical protein
VAGANRSGAADVAPAERRIGPDYRPSVAEFRHRRFVASSIAAAGIACVLWLSGAAGPTNVYAPRATPIAAVTGQAAVPSCTAEPRSFDEIQALRRLGEASPPARRTPGLVPTGSPADEATVAQVRATIEELLACFATGEPLRVWSLYTDDYMGRLLYRQRGFDRSLYDAYATPRPAGADELVELRTLTDVHLLADGRVGATVALFYPGIGLEKRFFFVFLRQDGRWRIDDVVGEITFSVP